LLKLLISLLESLNLLSLAFTRRLGSAAVSENTLNAALFLFVLSLSSLSGREICLGLREDLTPRLSLFGRLLLRGGGW
jgi:hypothetical protein